jgi:hypothetical protein
LNNLKRNKMTPKEKANELVEKYATRTFTGKEQRK